MYRDPDLAVRALIVRLRAEEGVGPLFEVLGRSDRLADFA
jgi:hypothetical protein